MAIQRSHKALSLLLPCHRSLVTCHCLSHPWRKGPMGVSSQPPGERHAGYGAAAAEPGRAGSSPACSACIRNDAEYRSCPHAGTRRQAPSRGQAPCPSAKRFPWGRTLPAAHSSAPSWHSPTNPHLLRYRPGPPFGLLPAFTPSAIRTPQRSPDSDRIPRADRPLRKDAVLRQAPCRRF